MSRPAPPPPQLQNWGVPRGAYLGLQKKFLMSGVTSFTHSFTCRPGCSKVAADTSPDLRYKRSCSCGEIGN